MELQRADQSLLVNYIDRNLVTVEETGERPSPVGAVLYKGGKRIAFVGGTWEGNLVAKVEDVKRDLKPEDLIGAKGRLLILNHLDELIIGQLDDEHWEVDVPPSIRSAPTPGVRLSYQNPINKDSDAFFIEEMDMIDLLTNKSGGIASFQGFGLPEENALFLEREIGGKKLGWLFFIHPKGEKNLGMDSVRGLHSFFLNYNGTVKEKAPSHMQTEALEALHRELAVGLLKFTSVVREEIFRSQVIANARMFERTGDEEYIEFLKRHLVTFQRFPWDLPQLALRKFIGVNVFLPDRNREVSKYTDNIILGEEIEAEEDNKEIGIYRNLTQQENIKIRKKVEDYYGDDSLEFRQYISHLADNMMKSTKKEEFDDIEVLLKEWEEWSLYQGQYHTDVNFTDNNATVLYRIYTIGKQTLIDRLRERMKLQKARHFVR